MKILSSEKNPDTGDNEVMVLLTNSEVKWLKTAVTKYIEDRHYDTDDYVQANLGESIRQKILECKDILNPA